jgi:hypothetical protein
VFSPKLLRYGTLFMYSVLDTYSIQVRVQFACDTHLILQLAYQSILTSLTDGFGQQYIFDTSRYVLDRYSLRIFSVRRSSREITTAVRKV